MIIDIPIGLVVICIGLYFRNLAKKSKKFGVTYLPPNPSLARMGLDRADDKGYQSRFELIILAYSILSVIFICIGILVVVRSLFR